MLSKKFEAPRDLIFLRHNVSVLKNFFSVDYSPHITARSFDSFFSETTFLERMIERNPCALTGVMESAFLFCFS